jgi:hypothetical protein
MCDSQDNGDGSCKVVVPKLMASERLCLLQLTSIKNYVLKKMLLLVPAN